MSDYLDRLARQAIYCDSCRQVVDQDLEPGRWRHKACTPPPYPDAAHAVFERIDAMRSNERKQARR